eukprot:1181466-Prorocentrum_minimum.AAC.1
MRPRVCRAPESTVGQPCGSLSAGNIRRIFGRIFETPCAEWYTTWCVCGCQVTAARCYTKGSTRTSAALSEIWGDSAQVAPCSRKSNLAASSVVVQYYALSKIWGDSARAAPRSRESNWQRAVQWGRGRLRVHAIPADLAVNGTVTVTVATVTGQSLAAAGSHRIRFRIVAVRHCAQLSGRLLRVLSP